MMKGRAFCKACQQETHLVNLVNGYCPPCSDELRAMIDDYDRVKPLDGDSYDDTRGDDNDNDC